MRKRTILILLLIGGIIITPVNASVLDDFWNKLTTPSKTPTQIKNTPITQNSGDLNEFMGKLYNLNTKTNIHFLNQELNDYNVNSIKVRMYKAPWSKCKECKIDFFIVKNKGIVDFYDNWGTDPKDVEVSLTYSQINKIYEYVKDGKIDFFDRWQIYAIYKTGG